MKVGVTIDKRHVFVFLAGIVLLIGALAVTAYGGNDPASVGHTPGEIDWNKVIEDSVKLTGKLTAQYNSDTAKIEISSGTNGYLDIIGSTENLDFRHDGETILRLDQVGDNGQPQAIVYGDLEVQGEVIGFDQGSSGNGCVLLSETTLVNQWVSVDVPSNCKGGNVCTLRLEHRQLDGHGSSAYGTYLQEDTPSNSIDNWYIYGGEQIGSSFEPIARSGSNGASGYPFNIILNIKDSSWTYAELVSDSSAEDNKKESISVRSEVTGTTRLHAC